MKYVRVILFFYWVDMLICYVSALEYGAAFKEGLTLLNLVYKPSITVLIGLVLGQLTMLFWKRESDALPFWGGLTLSSIGLLIYQVIVSN